MNNHIQVIARAVIIDDGHILLTCSTNGSKRYTYLPGGHVELGEPSKVALLRELTEELGVTDANITRLLGTHESLWHDSTNTLQHEINIIFATDVPGFSRHETPASQEAHISFVWAPLDQLADANLLPVIMRTRLAALLAGPAIEIITD